MREHPDELMADFQQYYGLDTAEIGRGIGLARAAALTCQLPLQARVHVALEPACAWSAADHRLAEISHAVRWLQWSKTDDGVHNRTRTMPRPVLPPGRAGGRHAGVDAREFDRIREEKLNGG